MSCKANTLTTRPRQWLSIDKFVRRCSEAIWGLMWYCIATAFFLWIKLPRASDEVSKNANISIEDNSLNSQRLCQNSSHQSVLFSSHIMLDMCAQWMEIRFLLFHVSAVHIKMIHQLIQINGFTWVSSTQFKYHIKRAL